MNLMTPAVDIARTEPSIVWHIIRINIQSRISCTSGPAAHPSSYHTSQPCQHALSKPSVSQASSALREGICWLTVCSNHCCWQSQTRTCYNDNFTHGLSSDVVNCTCFSCILLSAFCIPHFLLIRDGIYSLQGVPSKLSGSYDCQLTHP